MADETTNWYRSKVDSWLAVILCLPPISTIAVCVSLMATGRMSEFWIALTSFFFVLCIYVGLVFPMRYGLDSTFLIVRFGMCRQRIPLADIVEVHPTRNPLSSPALSLDRLRIQFGQGLFKAIMISPAERDEFLSELSAKTGLKRNGEVLKRMPSKER